MDVRPLPTVEEIAAWSQVGPAALVTAEKLAEDALAVRLGLAGVYTNYPVGIYLNEVSHRPAVCPESLFAVSGDRMIQVKLARQDLAIVKAAVQKVTGYEPPVTLPGDLQFKYCVKVAFSPFIRQLGERLNFFPRYGADGSVSSPSPIKSMLTSGLLGAGLGYGAGYLGEQLMPQTWQKGRLRKTLALLGGAAGAAPGAIWGAANVHDGRSFNDPSLLNHPAGATLQFSTGLDTIPRVSGGPSEAAGPYEKYAAASATLDVKLGERYKTACHNYAAAARETIKRAFEEVGYDSFAPDQAATLPTGPMAVNVDALGRTLWQSGASPETAGMTMAALEAAKMMPGGDGNDQWVTPLQMANLAAHMGAGYLSGAIVGNTLGLLTGLPEKTQETLKRTGMYVGIIKAVVPHLFG